MQIRPLNSAARNGIGSRFKSGHLVWGPWTRLGTTRSLQYLLQGKNIRFKNELALLQGALSRSLALAVIPVMFDGHSLNAELESEFCLSLICPVPQGRFGYSAHDLGSLMNVQVSACFIDVRFVLCHPETKADPLPESNAFRFEPDRGFHTGPHSQADGFYD